MLFVSHTSTTLRASPEDNGKALAEVAIWTPLRVDRRGGAQKEWAYVVVGPRTLRYDSIGGEAKPIAPTEFPVDAPIGWVRSEHLSPEPPTRAILVEQARGAPPDQREVLLRRAWALDPFDPVVRSMLPAVAVVRSPGLARSPFARADLVFGCRGDVARAVAVGSSLSLLGGLREPDFGSNICVGHLDLRPPCPPPTQEEEEIDDEDRIPGVEAVNKEILKERLSTIDADTAAFKAALSRLVPRFGNDGPALRLRLGSRPVERPVFVTTHLLAADGCTECVPVAGTVDVKVERLRVPQASAEPTLLHVVVPRYLGAAYDVVSAETAADVDGTRESYELRDGFEADPREELPPGEHFFIAPAACGCEC